VGSWRTETSGENLFLFHAFTAGQLVIEAEFAVAVVAGTGAVGLLCPFLSYMDYACVFSFGKSAAEIWCGG
jgi:hypothetical protein